MRSHKEFVELCALSTSGELDAQEQKRLTEHLAGCSDCREALRQFQRVADVGMPMLFQELAAQSIPVIAEGNRGGLDRRITDRRRRLNWNPVWLLFAAVVLLTIALGIYSYQIGRRSEIAAARAAADAADAKVAALEGKLSDAGRDREHLKQQLVKRDRAISNLHREIRMQLAVSVGLRDSLAKLKNTIQADEQNSRDAAALNSKLRQELAVAQALLGNTEAELRSIQTQQEETQHRVVGLDAQIDTLTSELREEKTTVDQQAELLSHDRDIRELMGARDLYIAEVYDVAQNGATRRPFGRVFYTKEKSLIFYAYDLEQQAAVRPTSAFQAWGRSGKGKALSLGIFYQDNSAKKRWVLKCDNPKELSEIDSVFVTVEPKGGSRTPTGKRLLFASLKIDANHP